MGYLAGIVETISCTPATAPRKFESGSESGTGSGACGRLERAGKLRRGVSFLSKPSVKIPESLAAYYVPNADGTFSLSKFDFIDLGR